MRLNHKNEGDVRDPCLTVWQALHFLELTITFGGHGMRVEAIPTVLPPIVWACDEEGQCLSLSAAWSVFTGHSVEAGLGWSFLDYVHADDRDQVQSAFEKSRSTGATFQVEYRLLCSDGNYRWVLDTAIPETRDGRFIGLTGAIVDNTARRAAEQLVRERERELQLVTDAVPVLISHIGQDGRYQFANAAYRDWYGADPETLIGRTIEDVLGTERYAERKNHIEAALRGEHVVYDGQISLKGGAVRDVETTYVPNICSGGHVNGFIAVVKDITERKQSLEQMRLMVGELKHHTANLLTMVQALARRSLRGEVRSPEAFHTFEGQLFALAAVTEAIAPRDIRQVSIASLVTKVTAPHKSPERNPFRIEGEDALVPSKFGVSFAMTLHELCTNATKYGALSRPEGIVRISWRIADDVLSFDWEEAGGPTVQTPERTGFGTSLLTRALAGGSVVLDYRPAGLFFAVEAPVAP
jgi:PAS domain S-box-containing protein